VIALEIFCCERLCSTSSENFHRLAFSRLTG
jgi:hypothetical protein